MLPKMVDMALSPAEQAEEMSGFSLASKYPYGLSISLGNEELKKLGLDADCEVGDMLHLFSLAKVTSVSSHDVGNGECCRIELQLCFIGLESEDSEDEEEEDEAPKKKIGPKNLYKK